MRSPEGTVAGLRRYPVKSMQGETAEAISVTARGIAGDRAYALLDAESGKVASAKNPRKWPDLFSYKATFTAPLNGDAHVPPVRITLPTGATVISDDPRAAEMLSKALGRTVTIAATPPAKPGLEEYWPDMPELAHQDVITEEAMPEATFFDCALVHLLTTATLRKYAGIYADGKWDLDRFRPNIVVDVPGEEFAENAWVGKTITIGTARLKVTSGTARCVMTTLPQGDLPADPQILRTAALHNEAHIGVYATVLTPGDVHAGDAVFVE
jgi:uncharacterized protein YcbX